jgi:hypothetical protein
MSCIRDRVTELLESFDKVEMSVNEVKRMTDQFEKDLKLSKLKYVKKEQKSIENSKKIFINC